MSQTTHKAAATAPAAAQGRSELRSALLEERRGYVQRGDKSRVDQVDVQVDALGPELEPDKPETATPETATPKRGRGSVKAAVAAAAVEPEQS